MNRPLTLWLAVSFLSGCAGVQLPKEKLTESPGGLMFNGYTKTPVDCFICHNGDAKGTMRGPSLAEKVVDDSDSQISETIKNGEGRMPAFKDQLSDVEIAELTTWLRTNFPAPVKPAPIPAT